MRLYKIALLLMLGVGLILRMNNLTGRSLWTDEFFTFFQSTGHGRIQYLLDSFSNSKQPELFKAKYFKQFLKNDPLKSIDDVTEGLIKEDTHPPFYFVIMHLWMKLFGDSITAVRSFSVLFGLLCILLAYKVTLYLFGEKAAIFAALFVSISPFAVRYSQEARCYSLITAIGLASWLFILKFERYKKNIYLVLFSIINCLGVFTHYFYIFIWCAQFLYITLTYRKDSLLRQRLYLASLFSILTFFVWFMLFCLKSYNFYLTEWAFGHPSPVIERIFYSFSTVMHYMLIFYTPKIYHLFLALILFVYIFRHSRQLVHCMIILFVPLLCMLLLDIIQQGALLKQERFSTFSFVGFIPLAGYILSNGSLKLKAAVYCFIMLLLLSSFLVIDRHYGPAPKFASGWINKKSEGSLSAVIVCNIRSVVIAQSNYLNDDIYLIPVKSREQLLKAIRVLSNLVKKVFIVRHFHRTDSSLMDRPFMGIKDIGSGFQLATSLHRDDISVLEFVK